MTHNPFSIFDNLPAISRGAIGFDDMFKRLSEWTETLPKVPTYPPYNVRKTGENTYVIEMAVAGFGKQDIELLLEDGVLTIKGHLTSEDVTSDYLFKGLADRAFTRKFTLADTVEVKNAELINGLLKIWLERFIPEHAKPKKIDINEAGHEYSSELDRLVTKKKKENKEAVA
jgi:molecular chaperone IbpA